MASHKRSAKEKRIAEFKAQLGGMDDMFEREHARVGKNARQKEAALRNKACESKNRYATQGEALAAAAACEDYGTPGLRVYRCKYCNGWHLTSKPQR